MADTAEWEKVQSKVFTKWCNMHLAKRGSQINNIVGDFTDGVKLIHLLEVISDETIPKYNKNPKMRIQKIENLNVALKFIENHDVKLASIGSEEIVDANPKLTLGMIWTIILRFAISGLSEEGVSAKQGLLLWVQKKTAGYKDVKVTNFTDSFKDGLAFAALIHKHRPDLLSYDGLAKENAEVNFDTAFNAGEVLGVPKLIDTQDILSMPIPDERCVMTYCAALYKVFSGYDKIDTAARRLAKFLNFAKQAEEMIHDYERRAKALLAALQDKIAELASATLENDYASVRSAIQEFKEYRKTLKRQWVVESSDLASLFGNIQSKLRVIQRPPYQPPAGLAPSELEGTLTNLTEREMERRHQLSERLRQILDRLRRAFSDPCNQCYNSLVAFKSFLAEECSAPLEKQTALYEGKKQELIQIVKPQLPVLQQAEQDCENANIDENEYCPHTYDDIKFMFEQLVIVADKKLLFIETQVMEAKGGVPADKLAEFRESFQQFDTDKNGCLSALEFRSAATSIGLVDVDFTSGSKDSECDKLFAKFSGGGNSVSFEQWVANMTKLAEDSCSPDQAAESFKTLADGKDWLTENDVLRLPAEQREFIQSSFPKGQNGYDYKAWMSSH